MGRVPPAAIPLPYKFFFAECGLVKSIHYDYVRPLTGARRLRICSFCSCVLDVFQD